MRVLADLHHGDLFYSLQLLFEKRLGFQLFRPIGLEWYHEKFWDVYPHINTAKQYLDIGSPHNVPRDIHGNVLPESAWGNVSYTIEDGVYQVVDFAKENKQRAITLEKMKSMKFDIIIASMPSHIAPFKRLIELYQPQAKLIFQIGNPGWKIPAGVFNILNSTVSKHLRPEMNAVSYHQEFDLDLFNYEAPAAHNTANSYIHYMPKIAMLNQYRAHLADWTFKTYGAGMEDCITKTSDIAATIKASGWTWHIKPNGDGFGHTLHNSYACGRPTIINKAHYAGMIGDALLEDQVTCIDIGGRSLKNNISILRKFSDPDLHRQMCENAYKRFTEVVNFDEEETRIRKFIEDLK